MRVGLFLLVLLPAAAYGFGIDVEVGRHQGAALLRGAAADPAGGSPGRLVEVRVLPPGVVAAGYQVVDERWAPARPDDGVAVGRAGGLGGTGLEERGQAAGDLVYVGSGALLGYNLLVVAAEAVRAGEDGPEVLESMRLRVECVPGAAGLEVGRRGAVTDKWLEGVIGDALGVDLEGRGYWRVTEATGAVTDEPSLDGSAVDCVIVTSDDLAPEFERLAAWHDLLGVRTVVRTVAWIESRYPGSDAPERIRNFLRDAYRQWGTVYALLGGDPGVVPIRSLQYDWLWAYTAETSDEIPVDCYYSNLDGTWNADGDARFGEAGSGGQDDGIDAYADMLVGRAPVGRLEDARAFVDKTILYTRGGKPGDWYDRAVFMAQIVFALPEFDGAEFAEQILEEFPADYEKIRLYQKYESYDGAIPETLENCLAYMNQGAGIVSHIGHGDFFRLNLGDEMMWRWQVDSLSNDSTFFFMYMMNCASANPDVESIAKNFIRNPAGGAVALIGNQVFAAPRNGLALEQSFFEMLFGSDNVTLGVVSTIPRQLYALPSRNYPWWTYLNSILYGDPCIRLWEAKPGSLEVTGAGTMALGDSLYDVTVEDGAAGVEGAVVVLAGRHGEYGAALTDAAGRASVRFRPRGTGDVDLVVSRDGYLPYEGRIAVGGSGGRLYVSGVTIDDSEGGAHAGNGDGEAGWGERVGLGVGVANGGSGTLAGVQGVLRPVAGCSLSVDVEFSGADPPIYVGAAGWSPSSSPFALGVGAGVLGRFTRDLGEEEGCWIWLDSMGWHVRLEGTGADGFAYRCSIEVYGDVTGHRAVHLEAGDGLTCTGGSLVFAGGLGDNDFEDGFDFQSGYEAGVVVHDGRVDFGDVGSGEVVGSFDVEFTGGPGIGPSVWFELALSDAGGGAWREWLPVVPADGMPSVEVFSGFGGFPYDFTIGIRNVGKGGLSGLVGTVRGLGGITIVDSVSSYGDLAGGAYAAGDGYSHGGFLDEPVVEIEIRDAFDRVWRDTVYERDVDAPGDLTYSVGAGFVELAWEPSEDERLDHYEIYRSDGKAGSGPAGIVRGHSRFVDYDVDGEEEYVYTLVARDDMGNASDETPGTHVWGGAPYLPGFPVEIRGAAWSSPAAGDADHDGLKEIFVGSRGQDLAAFDVHGQPLYRYPYICSCQVRSSPALVDLDGDGTLECVFGIGMGIEGGSGCAEVVALNHDGTAVTPTNNPGLDPGAPGWPQATGAIIRSAPAVYDLDEDGRPEVLIGTMGKVEGYGALYAYRYDGSPYLASGPIFGRCGNVIWTSPCVADLDGDGRVEVMAADLSGCLYVWKWDGGAYLPDSTVLLADTDGAFWASPAVGDVDGDGRPEIVAVNDKGRVYAWNGEDGTGGLIADLGGMCWSDPALADFDGDGAVEIAFGLGPEPGRLILIRGDGSPYGAAEAIFTCERSLGYVSPAIADIDEDGELEIICCSVDARIFGVNPDGTHARGFPRRIDGFIYASPLIADLDMDGDMELVVAGYDARVHVWDLEAAYSEEAVPWGMYHHDVWHTGLAGFEAPGDTIPPAHTIGVFQNTVVERVLDIYVAPSEYTRSAPSVEIATASGREVLEVESVPSVTRTYRAHYVTEAASAETVYVSSTDLSGNAGAEKRVLTYSEVIGGDLVAFSFDGVLEVESGPAVRASVVGILPVDAAYLESGAEEPPVQGVAYNVCRLGPGTEDLTLRLAAGPGDAVYVFDGGWAQVPSQFRQDGFIVVPAAAPGVYALGGRRAPVGADLDLRIVGPNPFSGDCRMSLAGAPESHVEVRVFDVSGRLVAEVYEGRLGEAGDIVWDGRDRAGRRVSSGIYFLSAQTAEAAVSRKMIHVR